MSTEIPIWVNGEIRWLSGIDKKTTCKDIVEVLLDREGIDKSQVNDFTIMERWRKVERPLDENSKILKIWTHWGDDKKEVRLCLRRIDNEVDSGRGSPIGSGGTPSFRKKRNRHKFYTKPALSHPEGLHPRRLAELGTFHKQKYNNYCIGNKKPPDFNDEKPTKHCISNHATQANLYEIYSDNENVNCYKKLTSKSYHCPRTGKLHSTPLTDYTNSRQQGKRCCSKRDSKQKGRNSENIEKLMKLILAQGATIQSQLQKLKERDEQIESIEQERHRERIEKNGRNYLLETYLGSLKEAEIPVEMEDEKAEDSGVNTEGGSDQIHAIKRKNIERLQQNETEPDSDPSLSRVRENNKRTSGFRRHYVISHNENDTLFSAKNGARSKSESRTNESKKTVANVNLKRSFSDNSIAKGSDLEGDDDKHTSTDQVGNLKKTQKNFDEIVEMQNIQSQIQMWERVFKINKKLEKEEENLVRLHIKIKKIQNENYRLAKGREDSETLVKPKEDETEINKKDDKIEKWMDYKMGDDEKSLCKSIENNLDEIDTESDYAKIKQDLKTIKSDLDTNSKEIYENFTRLIEEDELAEQKRNCLAQLISDLERTQEEEEMLNEMINMKILKTSKLKENLDLDTATSQKSNGPKNQSEKTANAEYFEILTEIDDNCDCSNPDEPLDKCQVAVNQRAEEELNARTKAQQFIKPKIVKISFEEEVKSSNDSSENRQEKSVREPGTVTAGALKGILKNRNKPTAIKDINIRDMTKNQNESHQLQTHQSICYPNNQNNHKFYQNCNSSNVVRITKTGDVSLQNDFHYSPGAWSTPCNNYTIQYLYEHNYTPVPQSSNFDVKTAYSFRGSHPHNMPTTSHSHAENSFSHNAIAKTKVLNDNDSSTSSDTSGLCSMYSSSPSVEPPYLENGYILDTLV